MVPKEERYKYNVWMNENCLDGRPWVARVWDTKYTRDVHWSRHRTKWLADFAIRRAKWKLAYPMAYRHVRALLGFVGTILCVGVGVTLLVSIAKLLPNPAFIGFIPLLVALYMYFYYHE